MSLRADPAVAQAIALSRLRRLPPPTLEKLIANAMVRVESAYGRDNFARLQGLKRKYDPTNVFRYNQNIPVTGS